LSGLEGLLIADDSALSIGVARSMSAMTPMATKFCCAAKSREVPTGEHTDKKKISADVT